MLNARNQFKDISFTLSPCLRILPLKGGKETFKQFKREFISVLKILSNPGTEPDTAIHTSLLSFFLPTI